MSVILGLSALVLGVYTHIL